MEGSRFEVSPGKKKLLKPYLKKQAGEEEMAHTCDPSYLEGKIPSQQNKPDVVVCVCIILANQET
jgi:hypothetical protein